MLLLFPSSAFSSILNSWSPGWETYNITVPFTRTYFSLCCYLQIQNWILWKLHWNIAIIILTEQLKSSLVMYTFWLRSILSNDISRLIVSVVRYFPSVIMVLEKEDTTFSSTLGNSLSTRYELCACANRMRTRGWVSQWLFGVLRGRYTPSVSEEFLKRS
jgi:hypothetical protein